MNRPPILSTDQPQEESVEQIMTGAPDYTAEQMDAMYVTPEEEIAALKARVAQLEREKAESIAYVDDVRRQLDRERAALRRLVPIVERKLDQCADCFYREVVIAMDEAREVSDDDTPTDMRERAASRRHPQEVRDAWRARANHIEELMADGTRKGETP